ncbi:MAG TPA: hypothetical protein PKZ30_08180, partial [Defluviitoga tunisiensis]|nr:hypothetical protein [Defluviitoga tunisiensis]
VEAALIDKPSIDEVEAMIEEKLGSIEVPDVEELTGRVTDLEDRVSAVETRLDDVDSAISDIMSSVDDLNANLVDLSGKVEEVLALKDQLDELIARIESIQGIEIPVELDEIKSFIMDLDSRLTELSTSVDDLSTVVADLQSQIDDINSKFDQVNTNIDNINSSIEALSTSVDDLFVLNDGVSTRLDETVNRLVTLEERVATLENKATVEKNFALDLRFTVKVGLATRTPVNTLTTKLTFNLMPNVKLFLQSVSSASGIDMSGGVDASMPISKDITGVAGASYDNGKFSVYGGVKLAMLKNAVIDVIVGVPDVMALGSGELKDTVSLKIGGSYKLTDKVSLTGYATNLEGGAAAANFAVVYAVDPKADLSLGLYLYGLGNLLGGNFDAVQKSVVFSAGASF